ncbi:hypothetical protein PF005_g7859 [Phytophthora fragariae]|uniref:BZIP domain-containing protein n=1 Tax=Phytophthora fragariae TaxID=53985 RepID=A0A6A3ZXL1_9STRA|nr:hypothetical protein PF003_g24395 [Phytophthora fragariae]KAE8943056.1 hypothetical protein PF009_g7211 [Phytophthora fragariae]KAE8986490.1 hypothetical protein PF011_g19967 [Phytophthora fragariae]KAE9074362.1 hypothetical protein PF007_g25444 [Phytophthora fragariae]KAE9121478.1 hypothetical protein PF010_g7100 [Phytophthora fragariae]
MAPNTRGEAASALPKASLGSLKWSDAEEKRSPSNHAASPLVSDDSEAKHDEQTSEQLSPRSRRRRKNRDQMRVARQKERETMQRLRETVHRLEVRYQETVNRGILNSPNESLSTAAAVDTSTDVSSSDYVKLVEEGARLQDENSQFRRALHEKNKLQETLERVYEDFHQPPTQEEVRMRRCVFEDQCAHDPWTPLTEEQVWVYIRATHERVTATLQAISQRAALREMDPSIRPLPPFLGWQVQYHRENDEVLFSFEKPFYHVTALQAMQHTWDNELSMQSYRKPVDAATQSMTVFQVINDDTYVFRRRIKVREQIATSYYLRFRLKTNSGYAIGNCSANAEPSQQQGKLWAANLSLWTHFKAAWSELDQEFCTVRITDRMSVDATESAATQAAVDIIFGLLSWENLNIGPVFTFTEG